LQLDHHAKPHVRFIGLLDHEAELRDELGA
jgi:hypothetical protein